MRLPRRPWTRLAGAAMAGHVFLELGAGVGMPFASVLGPVPAAAGWAVGTVAVQRAAGSPRHDTGIDTTLAVVNGVSVAAAAAHLAGWPRRRTRLGLPWLTECEGLGPELMRWYNPIVWTGGIAAAAGVLAENRGAPRWAGLLPLALVPVLVRLQHAEHERLRRLAVRRPGRWNRRLRA
jgi:hypothetical protein